MDIWGWNAKDLVEQSLIVGLIITALLLLGFGFFLGWMIFG